MADRGRNVCVKLDLVVLFARVFFFLSLAWAKSEDNGIVN